MYLYVSEIFPTEIRPIGMGFSLFGQFAGISIHITVILDGTDTQSYTNPPRDRSNGLQQRWLEVLPRHHLLVGVLHSE
jgi:hypothetical protein